MTAHRVSKKIPVRELPKRLKCHHFIFFYKNAKLNDWQHDGNIIIKKCVISFPVPVTCVKKKGSSDMEISIRFFFL